MTAYVDIRITRCGLPPVPEPSPGDDPIFEWATYAEVRVNEISGAVKRFAYWDEHDDKPIEVGFEAHIDGLPETGGVGDVVATHPGVFEDLAAVCNKLAELLRECQ
jgi:hypothetical protein